VRILQRADQIPPCVCRLYARSRNGTAPLSNAELARRVGVSRSLIVKVSRKTSWLGMLDLADDFAEACGVDFDRPAKVRRFFQRRQLAYFERTGPAQRKMYRNLITLSANQLNPHTRE
jgi:hypothetical protein